MTYHPRDCSGQLPKPTYHERSGEGFKLEVETNTPKDLHLQISVDLSGNICDNPCFITFLKEDKCENKIEFGQHSGDRR